MEILKYDVTFHEIPTQDNPAFDSNNQPHCLMIVRTIERNKWGNAPDGAEWTVLEIKGNEDPYNEETVTHLGKFWLIENAELFANSYSEKRAAKSS